MTSVASFGGATTAGNYVLWYNSVTVPLWVQSFRSRVSRKVPVQSRTNFWSSVITLDGYYPALVYHHDFLLYTESGSLHGQTENFFNLADLNTGSPAQLSVNAGDTTTIVFQFGNCYMESSPELVEPDQLLLHRAGFVALRFIGTVKPTVP